MVQSLGGLQELQGGLPGYNTAKHSTAEYSKLWLTKRSKNASTVFHFQFLLLFSIKSGI